MTDDEMYTTIYIGVTHRIIYPLTYCFQYILSFRHQRAQSFLQIGNGGDSLRSSNRSSKEDGEETLSDAGNDNSDRREHRYVHINTPSPHILSTHPRHTSSQHTISTHSLNTSSHILFLHSPIFVHGNTYSGERDYAINNNNKQHKNSHMHRAHRADRGVTSNHGLPRKGSTDMAARAPKSIYPNTSHSKSNHSFNNHHNATPTKRLPTADFDYDDDLELKALEEDLQEMDLTGIPTTSKYIMSLHFYSLID